MLLKLEEHVEIAELRELFLTSLCDRSCPCWDFRWGILTRKVARALLLKRSEIAQREEPYGARFDQLI